MGSLWEPYGKGVPFWGSPGNSTEEGIFGSGFQVQSLSEILKSVFFTNTSTVFFVENPTSSNSSNKMVQGVLSTKVSPTRYIHPQF